MFCIPRGCNTDVNHAFLQEDEVVIDWQGSLAEIMFSLFSQCI